MIVLIVGVPGAGKTTVARALAARFERAACIEGDLVQHHFTLRGLVGPDDPAPESDRQLRLRWRNCADLARNFAEAGFTTVVEHAASRRHWIDGFAEATAPLPLSLVVLAPDARVARERDLGRAEKHVSHLFGHMDAEMRTELAGLGFWLDTGGIDVDGTVDVLIGRGLEEGRVR